MQCLLTCETTHHLFLLQNHLYAAASSACVDQQSMHESVAWCIRWVAGGSILHLRMGGWRQPPATHSRCHFRPQLYRIAFLTVTIPRRHRRPWLAGPLRPLSPPQLLPPQLPVPQPWAWAS